MKVHLLEKGIDSFLDWALSAADDGWHFPHAIVGHFHTHWAALSGASLYDRYDQSLRSTISQSWWKRDGYRPKEIMLRLIEADPELAAIAWKDLAQAHASLEGRISRFSYYCEQLLDLHRDKHPRAIETYHHQDAAILSLYLAGLFPDQYALYPGLEVFRAFCLAVGSPDLPRVDDLARYMKVAGIVHTFLQRHARYPDLLAQRDPEREKVSCIPLLISYEVMAFMAKSPSPSRP